MKIKYIFNSLWIKICDKILYKYFKGMPWYDIFDYLSDYKLEKGKYVIKCKKCGQLLAPFVDFVGPKTCGWHLIKNNKQKFYICHQCMDHDYDKNSLSWWDNELKRRNNETIKKIKYYKNSHPWVKIRRDYL